MSQPEPKLGLFVPLTAKSTEITDVTEFLLKGYELVQDEFEPETLQWFALKDSTADGNHFLIFDTSAAESGRDSHLNGAVAAALMQNRDRLLVPGEKGVNIRKVNILASKVQRPADGLTKGLSGGIRVLIKAKVSKTQEVKDLLQGVLPSQTESSTPVWFAIEFPDTDDFGVLGFFTSDEEREAYAKGEGMEAMRAAAQGLFETPPEVVQFEVLATKIQAV